MSPRVYLLIDVTDGKCRRVAQTLRSKPGVTMLDVLEGPPDILVMVESHNRQKLAELTVNALVSVEDLTGNIQLLPGRYGLGTRARKARVKPGKLVSNSAQSGGV